MRLTARKEDLEKQVNILNKSLDKVQNELGVANANLNMAIHELDTYRAENACLREENSVLKDRETSFEEQVKRLVETPGWIAPDKAHPPQTVAVKRPEVKRAPHRQLYNGLDKVPPLRLNRRLYNILAGRSLQER